MRVETSREPALEDLLRAWGLRRIPFIVEEKNPSLFPIATHGEVLGQLNVTAALRGVMVASGPPGSGKSTLIKTWAGELEPKRYPPLGPAGSVLAHQRGGEAFGTTP